MQPQLCALDRGGPERRIDNIFSRGSPGKFPTR